MNKFVAANNFVSVTYVVPQVGPEQVIADQDQLTHDYSVTKEVKCVNGYLPTSTENVSDINPTDTEENKADSAFNYILTDIKKLGEDFEDINRQAVKDSRWERKPSSLPKIKKPKTGLRSKSFNAMRKELGIRLRDVSTASFRKQSNGWCVPKNKKYCLLVGDDIQFLVCTKDLKAENKKAKTALLTLSTDKRALYRKDKPYYSKTVC